MKIVKVVQSLSLVVLSLVMSVTSFAQEPTTSPTPQQRERVSKNSPTENPKTEPQPTETPAEPKTSESPIPEVKTDSTPQPTESAEDLEIKNAIVPHYVNYLSKYELGPEDVISIEVFGQCDKGLCKVISISPTAIVNFPFIPGGIFVGGKTTDQVAKEIAKKLDEYIIDPQVTVNLEKVMSARFAVLGKVGAPGVRTMTRRYSVVEAIVESGSFIQDADKKRITLLRLSPQGGYTSIPLKYDEMVAGKVPMEFLAPGDQLIVPEKKWSWNKVLQYVNMATGLRALAPVPGGRF
jgi:polysaccharide biosynthesis/export protein